MKRLLLVGLITAIFVLAGHAHPAVVFAGGRWIATDKVFDDDRPQPNETYTWSGGHDNDGYAAGPGTLQWYVDGKPENSYQGTMSGGKINGRGVGAFASGNRYEGDWVDGRRTGKGVFTWANGNRYEGDFVKDQRTGRGILTYANGDRYEGDWVDGRWTGKGVATYANGNRSEGDWVDGRLSGRGIMTFADGRRREGRWDNGAFLGPGQRSYYSVAVFLVVAGLAAWTTRSTVNDGRLSWPVLLKDTGLYLVLTVIGAFLVNFEVLGQVVFDWNIAGLGLDNTAIAFLLGGVIAAIAAGVAGKGRFSWRRARTCVPIYAMFSVILYSVWFGYAICYAIFILSLGGRH